MNTPHSARIRVAAERLVREARARHNRLSLSDAELAVVATAELHRRGVKLSVSSAAAAVAAADRELAALMWVVCKVLPAVGVNAKPFEEALNGNAPAEALPDTVTSPVPRPKIGRPSWRREQESALIDALY